MSRGEFKLRRDQLSKQLDGEDAVVLFSAKEDANRPYRQNSDFYYLTGFVEPESVAVLVPGRKEGEFVLFNRKRDRVKEVWCGPYAGQEGACMVFGADDAYPIERIDEILPNLLTDRKTVYSNVGPDDTRLKNWLDQRKSIDLGEVLHEMRLKKSPYELDIIRRAAEITAKGHLRAMQKCRPGIFEFELEAELLYEFTRLGGRLPAFETIVASGKNACTLHYSQNNKKMVAGELVLVDAGIQYDGYCTDVTRTFQVEGGFTPEQRAIYEIVLEARKRVVEEIKPGVLWNNLQSTAERIITEGLVNIGILRGNIESLLAQKSFKPFFMHKIGHWLGLDIHDVGGYGDKPCILRPNMVFTVEPGVYISPDIANIDDKWKGIGVRIEDNVLVTNNGSDVLTRKIPSDVTEIENIRK